MKKKLSTATVYLIGAGPGDPELLTLKAKRILASAEVILYDYLAHPNIVLMGQKALKVCVGKKKGANSVKQDQIHDLLLHYSKENSTIVRLKGGDPMVFGRCGEEMEFLKKNSINFEIIPGISSAIAAPTYAGIPITHRDHSHSVAFVTATRANDIQNMNIPSADTLILMMSLLRLEPLVKRLLEIRQKTTPVAIIESGTLASEKVLVGTLETIINQQKTANLKPPALLVVGDVAALSNSFDWRNHLPLKNRRFVLFRSMHQQSELRDQLYLAGAEVLALPLNKIETVHTALDQLNLTTFSHIIFTSENGVNSFFDCFMNQNQDSRTLAKKIILAIGPQTVSALHSKGIKPDLVPDLMTSTGIIKLLEHKLGIEDNVLIPTSSEADEALVQGLEPTGARIQQVIVYTNSNTAESEIGLDWIQPNDELIFMNSASVKRFNKIYTGLNQHKIFSIGPKTTQTLTEVGVKHSIESDQPSKAALLNIILENSI